MATLMESQFWPPGKMLDFQSAQLQRLLQHAREEVPFYRDRLAGVLAPGGSLDWARWQRLPILKRHDLRTQREALQARSIPPSHGKVGTISTSGSTGVPVTISVPQQFAARAALAWERMFALHGIGNDVVMAEFKLYLPDGSRMTRERIETRDHHGRPRHYLNRALDDTRKLELLGATGAQCLIDLPNHCEVLAHANLRNAAQVQLKWTLGIGMGFGARQRQLFRDSFGALALSPYSSKEGGLMAFQCPADATRFHVNREMLYHEILDTDDRPCAPGQSGRFIITPFYNFAQPLIRYDTGDLVTAGTACSCDSQLPVLSAIDGRADAIFRFPGAYRSFSRFDDTLVQSSLAADAYQFAQTEPTHIEVRYVAAQDAGAAACERVRRHVLDLLDVDVAVSFRRIAEIPANAGGKQQRVVCEVPEG